MWYLITEKKILDFNMQSQWNIIDCCTTKGGKHEPVQEYNGYNFNANCEQHEVWFFCLLEWIAFAVNWLQIST